MLVDDFDYYLPETSIAQKPVEPRNSSKLMVLSPKEEKTEDSHFYDLKKFLTPGDTLIFNDTRVIPARLMGNRKTGGRVEVFLLRRIDNNSWETLVKPGKKARIGEEIFFDETLSCVIRANTDFGGRIVEFKFNGIFEEILDKLGETPLPPYIHEKLDNSERYQTVYAREKGSAAAPTAGLHFTKEELRELENFGINLGFLTLHVGLGTFRPVKVKNIEEHKMHKEYYTLPQDTATLITETKAKGKRVIAVGTTAMRTMEAAATGENEIKGKSGATDIFIYPGYRFKIVDALITNFHLPKSTLLMLVSAFAGREFILKAYERAVKTDYRFFSFGDAMFITERA